MSINFQVINLINETELNQDLLNINTISAKQKDFWYNDEKDINCVIIKNMKFNASVSIPSSEKSYINDLFKKYFKINNLMISF